MEKVKNWGQYAPYILMTILFIVQCNLFVSPEKVEQKHREILREVAQIYTTKEQYNDLKMDMKDMKAKIDKMYDIVVIERKVNYVKNN